MTEPDDFMEIALQEARAAALEDEIPVGAIIVKDNEVLARCHNRNRTESNPTRHAEMMAIEAAALMLGNERLTGCDLYVTKEPCAMCAGAIVHARIRRVYIGARDIRYGACGTALSVCGNPCMNHVPEIIFDIRRDECSAVLRDFFREKRTTRTAQ